jgi:hypothetical protein
METIEQNVEYKNEKINELFVASRRFDENDSKIYSYLFNIIFNRTLIQNADELFEVSKNFKFNDFNHFIKFMGKLVFFGEEIQKHKFTNKNINTLNKEDFDIIMSIWWSLFSEHNQPETSAELP